MALDIEYLILMFAVGFVIGVLAGYLRAMNDRPDRLHYESLGD